MFLNVCSWSHHACIIHVFLSFYSSDSSVNLGTVKFISFFFRNQDFLFDNFIAHRQKVSYHEIINFLLVHVDSHSIHKDFEIELSIMIDECMEIYTFNHFFKLAQNHFTEFIGIFIIFFRKTLSSSMIFLILRLKTNLSLFLHHNILITILVLSFLLLYFKLKIVSFFHRKLIEHFWTVESLLCNFLFKFWKYFG